VQVSLRAFRDACNALGAAGGGLLPCLDSTGKAYDELDSYLSRFEAHFPRSPNTRGSTKHAQQARWVYDQEIDRKVESLQSNLAAALTMCSLALVPQMSLQISSTRQQLLDQTTDAREATALANNQIINDTQVIHAAAQAC